MNDIWLSNISLNICGDIDFFIYLKSIFLIAYLEMESKQYPMKLKIHPGKELSLCCFMTQFCIGVNIVIVDPTQFYQSLSHQWGGRKKPSMMLDGLETLPNF